MVRMNLNKYFSIAILFFTMILFVNAGDCRTKTKTANILDSEDVVDVLSTGVILSGI